MREFSFQTSMKSQIFLREGKKASPVVLLLHGYGQSGEDILNALGGCFPQSWTLVAPNAPYPFFSSKQKKMVCSWYFFDVDRKLFVVDREVARSMLSQLLPQFVSKEQEWYCVGFSQGGYMAPFAADVFTAPRLVVTINGRVRHEDLVSETQPFPIVALHGEQDETVDVSHSKKSCEILKAQGWSVDFRVIPKVGHALDPQLVSEVKSLFESRG